MYSICEFLKFQSQKLHPKRPSTAKMTPITEKRMVVKNHLLARGFYLNDGIKYGLDFLVYTDHPKKVHSKYGVIVYSTMTFQQLVSYQRVCNSNNKILVVAFVDASMDIRLVQCERFMTNPNAFKNVVDKDLESNGGSTEKMKDE